MRRRARSAPSHAAFRTATLLLVERRGMPRKVAAIVLLAVAGLTQQARAEENLNDFIKVFADEQQKLPDREQALVKATNLARALCSKPERVAPFKDALKPLMTSLAAKRADASFQKLTLAGFEGLQRI